MDSVLRIAGTRRMNYGNPQNGHGHNEAQAVSTVRALSGGYARDLHLHMRRGCALHLQRRRGIIGFAVQTGVASHVSYIFGRTYRERCVSLCVFWRTNKFYNSLLRLPGGSAGKTIIKRGEPRFQ